MDHCKYCNGRIFKKNKDNLICNKCIKKYKCNGKGECFDNKNRKMYNCIHNCVLKQCGRCFNDLPESFINYVWWHMY